MSFRRVFTTASAFRHFATKTKLPDFETQNLLNYTRLIQSYSEQGQMITLEQEFHKLKGNIENPKYPDDKRNLDKKCLNIVSTTLNAPLSQVLLFMREEEIPLIKPTIDHLNTLGFSEKVLLAHSARATRIPSNLNIPRANIFSFAPTEEAALVKSLKTKAPGVLGVLLGLGMSASHIDATRQLQAMKGVKVLGASLETLVKIFDFGTKAELAKLTGFDASTRHEEYKDHDRVEVLANEGVMIGMFKRNENGRLETYIPANFSPFENLHQGLASIYFKDYQGPLTLTLLVPQAPIKSRAKLLDITFGVQDHTVPCKANTALDSLEWMVRQHLSRLYLPARDETTESLRELVEKPDCFTLQIPIIPCHTLRPHHPHHGETTYTLLEGKITDIELPTSNQDAVELFISKGDALVVNETTKPLPIGYLRVSEEDEAKACQKMNTLLTQLQFYVNGNPVDFNLAYEKEALSQRLLAQPAADAHQSPRMR